MYSFRILFRNKHATIKYIDMTSNYALHHNAPLNVVMDMATHMAFDKTQYLIAAIKVKIFCHARVFQHAKLTHVTDAARSLPSELLCSVNPSQRIVCS